jgi:hypothetical protein
VIFKAKVLPAAQYHVVKKLFEVRVVLILARVKTLIQQLAMN